MEEREQLISEIAKYLVDVGTYYAKSGLSSEEMYDTDTSEGTANSLLARALKELERSA